MAFATPAFQVACCPRDARPGPRKSKATRHSVQGTEPEERRSVDRGFMRRLLDPFASPSPGLTEASKSNSRRNLRRTSAGPVGAGRRRRPGVEKEQVGRAASNGINL